MIYWIKWQTREGKRFFSAFFIAMIGGRNAEVEMQGQKNELKSPPSYGMTRVCHLRMQNGAFCGSIFSASVRFVQCLCGL